MVVSHVHLKIKTKHVKQFFALQDSSLMKYLQEMSSQHTTLKTTLT